MYKKLKKSSIFICAQIFRDLQMDHSDGGRRRKRGAFGWIEEDEYFKERAQRVFSERHQKQEKTYEIEYENMQEERKLEGKAPSKRQKKKATVNVPRYFTREEEERCPIVQINGSAGVRNCAYVSYSENAKNCIKKYVEERIFERELTTEEERELEKALLLARINGGYVRKLKKGTPSGDALIKWSEGVMAKVGKKGAKFEFVLRTTNLSLCCMGWGNKDDRQEYCEKKFVEEYLEGVYELEVVKSFFKCMVTDRIEEQVKQSRGNPDGKEILSENTSLDDIMEVDRAKVYFVKDLKEFGPKQSEWARQRKDRLVEEFGKDRGGKKLKVLDCCKFERFSVPSHIIVWGIETMSSTEHPYCTPYCVSAICMSTLGLEDMVDTYLHLDDPNDVTPSDDWIFEMFRHHSFEEKGLQTFAGIDCMTQFFEWAVETAVAIKRIEGPHFKNEKEGVLCYAFNGRRFDLKILLQCVDITGYEYAGGRCMLGKSVEVGSCIKKFPIYWRQTLEDWAVKDLAASWERTQKISKEMKAWRAGEEDEEWDDPVALPGFRDVEILDFRDVLDHVSPCTLSELCENLKIPSCIEKKHFNFFKVRSWEDAVKWESEWRPYVGNDVLTTCWAIGLIEWTRSSALALMLDKLPASKKMPAGRETSFGVYKYMTLAQMAESFVYRYSNVIVTAYRRDLGKQINNITMVGGKTDVFLGGRRARLGWKPDFDDGCLVEPTWLSNLPNYVPPRDENDLKERLFVLGAFPQESMRLLLWSTFAGDEEEYIRTVVEKEELENGEEWDLYELFYDDPVNMNFKLSKFYAWLMERSDVWVEKHINLNSDLLEDGDLQYLFWCVKSKNGAKV